MGESHFIDVNGNFYTEKDFNSGASLEGVEFVDLDLVATNIKVIPKGLIIRSNLSLENTEVELISEGLVVKGCLTLTGSKVTHLPDNLSVRNLDLVESNIKSIGDIKVLKDIRTDSSSYFNRQVKCETLSLARNFGYGVNSESDSEDETEIETEQFDASNIITDIVYVQGESFSLINVDCDTLYITDLECQGNMFVTLQNSRINNLKVVSNYSSGVIRLLIEPTVTCNSLHVETGSTGAVHLKLTGTVQEAILENKSSPFSLVVDELSVQGNLTIKKSASSSSGLFILPSHGVVYGDIVKFKEFRLPTKFCCTGNIMNT